MQALGRKNTIFKIMEPNLLFDVVRSFQLKANVMNTMNAYKRKVLLLNPKFSKLNKFILI